MFAHTSKVSSPYRHCSAQRFPSALVDGGFATWSNAKTSLGTFVVSHPGVRWQNMRNILGWSTLQNHSVIHSSFTVAPLQSSPGNDERSPVLQVTLKQGSYIAILERDRDSVTGDVAWNEGDIYAQSNSPLRIPLAALLRRREPTTFDVFISADYEIRLFGDPQSDEGRSEPVTRVCLDVSVISPAMPLFDADFTVPDVLDGWLLGDTIGLKIQNTDHWKTLDDLSCDFDVSRMLPQRPFLSLLSFEFRNYPSSWSQTLRD